MIGESLPCDSEDDRLAVHVLFCALDIEQITSFGLKGYYDRAKCFQHIDIFFPFISESSFTLPYLECLTLGHCHEKGSEDVVLYFQKRLKEVRRAWLFGGARPNILEPLP